MKQPERETGLPKWIAILAVIVALTVAVARAHLETWAKEVGPYGPQLVLVIVFVIFFAVLRVIKLAFRKV